MNWHDLFVALALFLVIEGIIPFVNPAGLRRIMLALSSMDDAQLRFAGLTSMLGGIALLYFING